MISGEIRVRRGKCTSIRGGSGGYREILQDMGKCFWDMNDLLRCRFQGPGKELIEEIHCGTGKV